MPTKACRLGARFCTMKCLVRSLSVTSIFLLASSLGMAANQKIVVVNGDFEDAAIPLNGWSAAGSGGAADVQVSSGFWRKCTVRFSSGPYAKATLYIGAYASPSGRCWIDNLQPSGFAVVNPGFEQLTPDGKACAGWSLDGPGSITRIDNARASEGKHSIMLFDPSCAAEMIRVSQTVEVKPNTDCSYTFDFYMEDDFYGGIRCSVLAADTPEYAYLGGLVEDLDEVIADRSFVGSRQARLRLEGGDVSLSQRIGVPSGAMLETSFSVKCKKLEGDVKMDVVDGRTGRVLASAKGDPTRKDWNALKARFVSVSSSVSIRVEGTGKGEVLLDNVRLSYPQLLPEPQRIVWRKAKDSLPLSGRLTYSIRSIRPGELQAASGLLKTGLEILRKDLSPMSATLEESADGRGELRIVIDAKAPNIPKGKGEESYYLKIDRKGVVVEAVTERGAFYGLMTLLQLLSKDNDGVP
ncbi:MAG: glycoside hydrolase family 20 zincin-like fold domain-containing protein, partial [Armatimonadetes bacterium]|nr:glycoside hydrolase family 20 zincin-like fold domain-containing protein [Armatimonadota bacterium]